MDIPITPILFLLVWFVFIVLLMGIQGDIIARISILYPDERKKYVSVWSSFSLNERLEFSYFMKNIENGEIKDEILIGYYKKLKFYFILFIASFFVLPLSVPLHMWITGKL